MQGDMAILKLVAEPVAGIAEFFNKPGKVSDIAFTSDTNIFIVFTPVVVTFRMG